ncbi:MAG TPA: hypothetical protein VFM81_06260 [Actinomycetota bacterium]|nr:hypothetical protein [Actinomycetota bacterium]
MSEQKARKRDVRTRMTKTGERYTAARRNIVKPPPLPPRAAEPLVSDASVRRGTGKRWDEWFRILDAWGATEHTHTEIARHVNAELGVDGWWSQNVTVGYERARGMRAAHQRPDGFSVGVTKTFAVGAERLHGMFAQARQRNRWLEKGTLTLRTATAPKSARFDFRDGASRVVVGITAKGPSKSTAAIQHERLPSAEGVTEMRAFWKERLAALADLLGG